MIVPLSISDEQKSTGQGMDSLNPTSEAGAYCKACEDPNIIPIYPLRIAYADLTGELDADFSYPKAGIKAFVDKTSVSERQGFTLRMLRDGYIYIYDENNAVWSVFQYAAGSTNEDEDKDNPKGIAESFTKMYWKKGNPDDDWLTTKESGLKIVYAPKSAQNIWICYSQHRWSASIFKKAHGDEKYRSRIMLKVNLLNPDGEPFLDDLNKLGKYAEDFSSKGKKGLTQTADDWNLLSDLSLKTREASTITEINNVTKAKGKPVLVGLHDPLGVVTEMVMAHMNRIHLRTQYLDQHAYPLTIARAVDVFLAPGETPNNAKFYDDWKEAVDPAYKTLLQDAETTLTNYEDTLTGILDTWATYYQLGAAAPENTPGSLQTYMTTFDPQSTLPREVQDRIKVASQCIAGLGASQRGQKAIQEIVLNASEWQSDKSVVPAIIKSTTAAMQASSTVTDVIKARPEKLSTLLSDLAIPGAIEITQLKRTDIFQEISKLYKGITTKSITRIEVPIDHAMHEILHGRPRIQQSTQLISRGQRIHRVQTPTAQYAFEGKINVLGSEGLHILSKNLQRASSGFVMMTSALNLYSLMQGMTSERDLLRGTAGRLADPRLALFLTILETTTNVIQLPGKNLLKSASRVSYSYNIRGNMSKRILGKLLRGTEVTDDFAKSLVNTGRVATVSHSGTGGLMKIVGHVGTGVGFALAALDLFNAYEAYQRGDDMAVVSNAALGVGAILVTGGMAIAASTGAISAGVGVAIGAVLIVIGLVASFFVDDPVTRWLKNSFWGTSDNYLFWDDKDREDMAKFVDVEDIYEAQLSILNSEKNITELELNPPRYMQRELQEFHEFVYWPQQIHFDELKGTREIGIWPFNRYTTRTAASSGFAQARFRLPNFIDGISELDARVYVEIHQELSPSSRKVFWATNNRFMYRHIDITNEFKENLKIIRDDILESTFRIPVYFTENEDQYEYNNIYWDVTRIYFGSGWRYSPKERIELPIQYNDYWIEEGWEIDKIGSEKELVIYGRNI